jgi:succinoglycan biosynthesis transport protein ExoP
LLDTRESTGNIDPERQAKTQATLARGPAVARLAIARARLRNRSATDFLNNSSVSARSGEDILVFEARSDNSAIARRSASAHAHAYTTYRRRLDTLAIRRAREEAEARIAQLEASGEKGSPLYDDLVNRTQQLRTLEALQTSNAYVVREAGVANQVEPKPVRNGLLGLVLGVMVAVAAAILWDRLDTRVRSSDEVEGTLGVPLLGRIAEPGKRFRSGDRLVSLAEPDSTEAEGFRILATNLEFANLDRGARSLLVTSAVDDEGKSTTIANLAVTIARGGRHVVLVDMDLRRFSLGKFFGLQRGPGLSDVVLGRLGLEEALNPILLEEKLSVLSDAGASNWGQLEVLTVGSVPPNPSGFVGSPAVTEIMNQLSARADVVLIDTSPILQVGDAIALSTSVDAILVVTRLKMLRRPQLRELRRVLHTCPAPTLGFIATDSDAEASYGYPYASYTRSATATAQREPVR